MTPFPIGPFILKALIKKLIEIALSVYIFNVPTLSIEIYGTVLVAVHFSS
jgi:hypothetical protein